MAKKLTNTFAKFDDKLHSELKDPEFAKGYLEEIFKQYLDDGNREAFLYCLKPLIKSQGTIKDFAQKVGINRTYIYKIFNNKVSPDFETIIKIIDKLGFEFSINIKKSA